MAGLTDEQPRDLVVRAYWQNMNATTEYRPNDWRRPEFHEGDAPARAREDITHWLKQDPGMIRAVRSVRDDVLPGGGRSRAGEAVASWLDELLYGGGRVLVRSKDDRISIQLMADMWARSEVCRMDFGRLMDEVAETDI